MGNVRVNFKDNVECPPVLPEYQTYLLEYFPGSFGDFLAGLISYSIEEYYDCHSSENMNKRYWNRYDNITGPGTEKPDLVLKYGYILSLKGEGWEHVPKYNDFILSHFCHHKHRGVFYDKNSTKLLFNCHPMISDTKLEIKHFRSQYHDFKITKTFLVHPGKSFDILWLHTLNFYCTSPGYVWDKQNGDYSNLISTWKYMCDVRKLVEDYKFNTINIGNISEITPDIIKPFGRVQTTKFKEMKDAFINIKFNKLEERAKEIKQTLIDNKTYSHVLSIWKQSQ